MGQIAPVLLHLGGIDEIGMFVVPAAGIIWFLRRSERRAQERQLAESDDGGVEGPPGDR